MLELAWQWGYFGALAIMIGVSLGPLLFFKRRGWL
jgi:Mg2+ and Co2+ transporter CorA